MNTKIKICKVCGKICGNKLHEYIKGMCSKHYLQVKKYGKPLDNNPRTVYDANEIRVLNDYAEIDTYNFIGEVLSTFKLDIEDIPLLGNHKWRTVFKGKQKSPYLITGHGGSQGNDQIYFHRLVMGNISEEVDHINRDSTDNRKENLRISNRTQQLANTSLRENNTQGVKGVYFIANRGKYRAEISCKKKRIMSPLYETKAEAAYFRYLLEQLFYKDIGIYNSKELIELIKSVTEEQRSSINNYFKNRAKAWV